MRGIRHQHFNGKNFCSRSTITLRGLTCSKRRVCQCFRGNHISIGAELNRSKWRRIGRRLGVLRAGCSRLFCTGTSARSRRRRLRACAGARRASRCLRRVCSPLRRNSRCNVGSNGSRCACGGIACRLRCGFRFSRALCFSRGNLTARARGSRLARRGLLGGRRCSLPRRFRRCRRFRCRCFHRRLGIRCSSRFSRGFLCSGRALTCCWLLSGGSIALRGSRSNLGSGNIGRRGSFTGIGSGSSRSRLLTRCSALGLRRRRCSRRCIRRNRFGYSSFEFVTHLCVLHFLPVLHERL